MISHLLLGQLLLSLLLIVVQLFIECKPILTNGSGHTYYLIPVQEYYSVLARTLF